MIFSFFPSVGSTSVVSQPQSPCTCNVCTGYDTNSACPPLIVLAVIATSQAPNSPARGAQ
jgi:hypothetical protein